MPTKKLDLPIYDDPKINVMLLGEISTFDLKKWVRNQIIFLRPTLIFAGLLYLGALLPLLQEPGHVVSLRDFVPSSQVVTSFVTYIALGWYDFLRRIQAE